MTARRTARLAVVHAMADQGATLPTIAAAVGVTLSALREWLNRNDPDVLDRINSVTVSPSGTPCTVIDDEARP